MCDDTPTATPVDESSASAPTMRRICCIAAPRRRGPSVADQLRAAAVWAQILQGAESAREQAQIAEPSDESPTG
ncbi:hypothetical protein EKD04_007715 [Chloroflexales bacterium ZM16-3]|nr:hypothetical protein [Chloroflexales bacterium ZM16-3]